MPTTEVVNAIVRPLSPRSGPSGAPDMVPGVRLPNDRDLIPTVRVDLGNLNVVINTLVSNMKDLNARTEEAEAQVQIMEERKDEYEQSLQRANSRIQELESTRGEWERKLSGSDKVFHREIQHVEEQLSLLSEKVETSTETIHHVQLQAGERATERVEVALQRMNARMHDLETGRADWERKMSGMEKITSSRVELNDIATRLDLVENRMHEHRATMLSTLDDVRTDLDAKSTGTDVHRLGTRQEQALNDFKVLSLNQTKLDQEMSDLKQLYAIVGDLNERITNTYGNIESSCVASSADVGEVKGKLENVNTRQTALELKMTEVNRMVQNQLEDVVSGLTGKMESLVMSKYAGLESKVAQRMDGVGAEGKQWRNEQRQVLTLLEEKFEQHEQLTAKLSGQMDGSVTERINQNQVDLRELARRVDLAVADRNDMTQGMRSELSQVQEIIHGLQQQYDTLLSDAAQRNEAWADMARDLRARMDQTETTVFTSRSVLETTLDEIRHEASSGAAEALGDLHTNVEVLIAENTRHKALLQRLEDDTHVNIKALADFDEQFTRDLGELKDNAGGNTGDVQQLKMRQDQTDQRLDQDNARLAKILLELDEQVNGAVRQAKAASTDSQAEVAGLRSALTDVQHECKDLAEDRDKNRSVLEDLIHSQDELGEVVNAQGEKYEAQLKRLDGGLSAAQHTCRELAEGHDRVQAVVDDVAQTQSELTEAVSRQSARVEPQVKRLEAQMAGVQHVCKDLSDGHEQTQASMEEVLQSHTQLGKLVSNQSAKLEPQVKRMEAQLGGVQKVCKDLALRDDQLQATIADLHSTNVEFSSSLGSVVSKVETAMSKLASDSALKSLQAQVDGSHRRMQTEIELVQDGMREMQSQVSTDLQARLSKASNGVRDMGIKVEALEIGLKDQQAALEAASEELRGQTDDKAEANLRRIERVTDDVKGLKAATQKMDASLNDSRAASRQLGEINDRITSDLRELRTAAGGLGTEIAHLKAKGDKQSQQHQQLESKFEETTERMSDVMNETKDQVNGMMQAGVKELKGEVGKLKAETVALDQKLNTAQQNAQQHVSQQLVAMNDKVDGKMRGVDEKMFEHVEGLTGKLEKVQAMAKGTQQGLEESKAQANNNFGNRIDELTGKVEMVISKQEVVERLHSFGVGMCNDLKQQIEQIESDTRRFNDEVREELENDMLKKLSDFDKKLQVIHEREKTLGDIKEFGVKLVQELQGQVSAISRRVETDMYNMGALFDLQRDEIETLASVSEQQRVEMLHRKPAFSTILAKLRESSGTGAMPMPATIERPPSSSESRQRSGSENKPAVGLEIDDTGDGVTVTTVKEGGASHRAGLLPGDIIMSLNGVPVDNRDDYKRIIRGFKPGDTVEHTVKRHSGEVESVDVKLTTNRRSGR